ncbi:MAG: hypothetical protein ACKN9U_20850, partial [Pirellulaceae bacterium]
MEEQSGQVAGKSLTNQPKPTEEARSRWGWTEPSVWTNPMLATLEQNSVRGGKGYPNAFFADHGLLSLAALYDRESQSLKRKP